jgi:hypothetical protein
MVIGLMSTLNTQFTSPAVRHLTWCLLSPPLASLNSVPSLNITKDDSLLVWLDKLDNNPSHLLEYIQENNHKLLGSYFECLWQYYFLYGPGVSLYADHVQINDQKQTLGELDLLTQINGHPYHVELAVKFYLQKPNTTGSEQSDWVGPQSRDRLDIKIDKLIHKQFPFLSHPATTNRLKDLNLPNTYQQTLALKGYLFNQLKMHYTLPDICETGLCMGNWLHASKIQSLIQSPQGTNRQWCLLPKHEWLGDFSADQRATESDLQLMDSCTLEILIHQHFYQNENPKKIYALMVVSLIKNGASYIEDQRFFIVHDQWPETL